MKRILGLLAIVLFVNTVAYSQDIITRKNGQVLKVRIVEVGSSEVKYKLFEEEDGPIYVLERDRISKIKYESGKEEKLEIDSNDQEIYQGQKRQAVKINFLSPLTGHTLISYERSHKLGQSFELSLSLIGAGKNRELDWSDGSITEKNRDQVGLGIGAGYKFIKLPNFQSGRMRYTHIMQGSYAKPSVYLGSFKENMVIRKNNSQYVLDRKSITFGAFQLELGRQWVLGNSFLLDTYGGVGVGFDNRRENGFFSDRDGRSASSYNYATTRVGYSPGLSFSGGIKLGYLF